MSRILPGHFRRDGRAKKSFKTKQEAQAFALKHHKRAYPCDFGPDEHYHVGGTDGTKQRRY